MKIIIGICHPKDVHLWKNTITNLIDSGCDVKILAWDKDIDLYLLKKYNFEFKVVGKSYKSLFKKTCDMVQSDIAVLKFAEKFKPDLLVHGAPYLAHVSRIIGKPYIGFIDTEVATLSQLMTFPFSDAICTPSCFYKKIDPKKQITFNGYSELAYLHPNYFKPNLSVLDNLGFSREDKIIVIRFVAWGASHDIKQHGFINKEEFINKLEKYGKVLITSEGKIPENLEKYKVTIPPENIHDLLYYSTMYIGEGATMAAEAAILGTPALYVNSIRLGYIDDLEKSGLLYTYSNQRTAQKQAFIRAMELLADNNLKSNWKIKREKLLNEKIDVTQFLTKLITDYPESFEKLRNSTRDSSREIL